MEVKQGNPLENSKVVIIGLARDCAHSLPCLLARFSEFGSELADWGYVFLENGSTDDTLSLLRSFDAHHQKGVVTTFPNLETLVKKRTERLSQLRNHALKVALQDPKFKNFDFVLIVDLDGINHVFPSSRLLDHIADWPEDQAAVFANQTKLYYDVWAYRHPVHSPNDCWKMVQNRPQNMSKREAHSEFVKSRRIPFPKEAGLVEVDSAFGGLGIYKISAIKGCEYLGIDDEGHEICEHVEFHNQIREKGYKLFIDAGMINGSGKGPHGPTVLKHLLMRIPQSFRNFVNRQ